MNIFTFEIANRLRQPRQQDSYISFVSSASTIGIGLGCAVLILLLSVMNGFEYELRNSLLKAVAHAEIFAVDNNGLFPEPEFIETVDADPRVSKVFLLNKASGLIQAGKKMKSVSVLGADDEYFLHKFTGSENLSQNNQNALAFQALQTQNNGVLLGKKLMQEQDIKVGDKIQLLLPASSKDLSFQAPRNAWIVVKGSISVGGELDKQLAIINKDFLSNLLGIGQNITHIEISLDDPFNAYQLVREYGYSFSQAAYMSDWTRTNGHLYQDIQLIRTVVYIVLVLVIAVACFNIVSALIMSVKEKSKEIAILKTIGATNQQIASIFVLKGLYHGLKGAFWGTLIGIFLSIYLSDIIVFIEQNLNLQIFSIDIYFTNSIPSKLAWSDVGITLVVVLFIAILATLYPAKKAAQIEPAANLH